MVKCGICGGEKVSIIYEDYIRNGGVGQLTDKPYIMYQCEECYTIWHDLNKNQNKSYYESEQYREELEHSADVLDYYNLHDTEVLEKLMYTGTGIYRDKIVADIGCGGGSLLDYIGGVSKKTIAIEPSKRYREELKKKGHLVYAYADDAIKDKIKADIILSYDVIEHVDSPVAFMKEVYDLLNDGGEAYIGTPTDAPFLRKLLGQQYEQFLFSFQHPWVLSSKSLGLICNKVGFDNIKIKQVQRYGLYNALMWLRDRKPYGHINNDLISGTLEGCFKMNLEERDMGDYVILHAKRPIS